MKRSYRRVVFDATPIRPRMKGLGLFLRSLLDEFEKGQPDWLKQVYVDESYAQEAAARWPNLSLLSVKSSPAILWEQWRLPRLLGKCEGAVLFTGRDRVAFSLAGRAVMYLFEIPDYRVEAARKNSPGWYSQMSGAYNLWNFRRVAPNLMGLIASSHATLKDVIERYVVPPEICQVVYASIPDRFKEEVSEELRKEARSTLTDGRPYVLHFSTGDPRDNSIVALEAFAKACEYIGWDVILLIVGTNPEVNRELFEQAETLGVSGRVKMLPYLSENELITAYRGAAVYLDPTLYEGFGMQLVEAMACGVPVLSSNTTSVPEIVKGSGLLYDPNDIDGFAQGLGKILNDVRARSELIARGMQRAATFSYSSTAKQVSAFLEHGASK